MTKLSQSQWDKLRVEYCTTKITYRELAKKYDTTAKTICERSKKENWKKLLQDSEQKVNEKLAEKIAEKRIKVSERHIQLSDKVLDILEKVLEAEGFSDDKRISTKLKSLAETLESCQRTQRTALNMDKVEIENDLPEVSIIEGVDLEDI